MTVQAWPQQAIAATGFVLIARTRGFATRVVIIAMYDPMATHVFTVMEKTLL
jgi:hypothetical protein